MKKLIRVHVIKMPTRDKDVFPYSHYRDNNHDPYLEVKKVGENLNVICKDRFKLKANFQGNPKFRIDIYIPKYSARLLAEEIVDNFGIGVVGDDAISNPNDYRSGKQTLPIIEKPKVLKYTKTTFNIAGIEAEGNNNPIYVELESPNKNHIQMVEQEVHLGIPLDKLSGTLNNLLVKEEENDANKYGKKGRIRKANGVFVMELSESEAKNLAATLQYLLK